MDKEYLAKIEELFPVLVRGLGITDPKGLCGVDITFAQFFTLQTLMAKARYTMSELAKAMGVTMGNMTGMIDRLIKDQLVKRIRSEEDRRVVVVELTKKGRKIAEEIQRKKQEHILAILRRITEENKRILIRMLEELAQAILAEEKARGYERKPAAVAVRV